MSYNRQDLLRKCNQPEDKLLLAKVLDQADFSLKKRMETFTDFIDPGHMEMCLAAVSAIRGLHFLAFGGKGDCERKILGFSFLEEGLSEEDFPIAKIQVTRNIKYSSTLTHRDYLGSVLGLGLSRTKIGDILVREEDAILFVQEEIAEYICTNLVQAGRTKVRAKRLDTLEGILSEEAGEQKRTTVPSLRLDAVLGAAFHLSRGKVQELIAQEKAFVNWKVCKSASCQISEGDMLTLRGFGRVKLTEITGRTKKERIGILFQEYC